MSRLMVGVLAAVAAVVLVGALFRLFDAASAPPIVIADPPAPAAIVVAVEGAVATPGLYRLPGDARHGDAISAAGGFAPNADRALVNLARRLRDEDRLVVPTRVVAAQAAPTNAPSAASGSARSSPTAGPTTAVTAEPAAAESAGAAGIVDLNTATVAELEDLPEIGPTIAARIVALREERGAFRSVDELVEVEGISPRMVEELRPLVTVGA